MTDSTAELAALIRAQLRERFGRWSDDDPIMVALDQIASRPAVGEEGLLLGLADELAGNPSVLISRDGIVAALRQRAALAATPAGPEAIDVEDGASRIARERRRQIEREGYRPEHDAEHENGGLACAGAVYAIPKTYRSHNIMDSLWPISWPFKPTPEDRIRELEKAGALIAAEIDRLLRLENTDD